MSQMNFKNVETTGLATLWNRILTKSPGVMTDALPTSLSKPASTPVSHVSTACGAPPICAHCF